MNPFITKWLLSLIMGGSWVVISTVIAERISGRLGGLILGLPTTAVVGLLFIGLTQGVEATLTASVIVPLMSGLYCFFFLAYLVQTKRGFAKGLTIALLIWLVFAVVASKLSVTSLIISSIIWLLLVIGTIWWANKNVQIDNKLIPKNIQGGPLWLKAILSGFVISSIVLIGKFAGPTWGGIFAAFPALTVSTFLITIKSGGVEFTRLIAKNIHISTTTTVGLYAILVYFFYPVFGIIPGTIAAYIILLLISIPLYRLVFDKLKE